MFSLIKIYNTLTYDLNLDTGVGHKTRHYRICCLVIFGGYLSWIYFSETFPELVNDQQFFSIILSALGMMTLFMSYHWETIKRNIEKIVLFLFAGVLAHCIYLTQINPTQPGVWISSYMGFSCCAILIRNFKLLALYLVMGIAGFVAVNTFGTRSELIAYFVISTVILGITLLSTVRTDIWSLLALKEKKRKINELNRQQAFIIDQLSHDLKTPLVPLVGLLPTLKSFDDKSARILDLCIQSANHIAYSIRQIASYGAVVNASSEKNLETLDLSQHILNAARQTLQFVDQPASRTQFAIEAGLVIPGNPFLIEQLVTNLISNAVKFSHENTPIHVSLNLEKGHACLRVRDHGVGMSKEDAERVFEPFFRADQARTKKDSTGLGLTICKKITEIHKGQIEIESTTIGLGTTIKVILPVQMTVTNIQQQEAS